MISGSLASPTPLGGGLREERGHEVIRPMRMIAIYRMSHPSLTDRRSNSYLRLSFLTEACKGIISAIKIAAARKTSGVIAHP